MVWVWAALLSSSGTLERLLPQTVLLQHSLSKSLFKQIAWNLRQTLIVVPTRERQAPLPILLSSFPSPTLSRFPNICGGTGLWVIEFDGKEKPQSNPPAGHQLQPGWVNKLQTRYHIHTSEHTGNSVRCHSSLVTARWTDWNGQKFCHGFH